MSYNYNAVKVHKRDNVAVIIGDGVKKGQEIKVIGSGKIVALEDIKAGHKVSLKDISKGEEIIKYGYTIGCATQNINCGMWVHVHNMKTALKENETYTYQKDSNCVTQMRLGSFNGYLRKNGTVGIRNEIWILPMVSCVNHTAKLIADNFRKLPPYIDQLAALQQPYGCSQLGDDHRATVAILRNIAMHPNAAGVLLLSLGCENNVLSDFLEELGDYDHSRIKYLVCQDHEDEIAEGTKLVEDLINNASKDLRTEQPLSKLCVGLKCGGSDGFSGITANPLVGKVCDLLVENGASVVLSEVPEMFGAETILMNRASDSKVFDDIVSMIEDFKNYFISHNQPIYENPSPGNKDGGVTTLEEKSLGCTQKGGHAEVTDVLKYGERVRKNGLSLLSSPGNDVVSCTAMAGAGCQMLLFTTGRGTPLSTFVPTIKVASNTPLARRKHSWIDFDAGPVLYGNIENLSQELFSMVLKVANGELMTCSEKSGFKEVGIFKKGVTL